MWKRIEHHLDIFLNSFPFHVFWMLGIKFCSTFALFVKIQWDLRKMVFEFLFTRYIVDPRKIVSQTVKRSGCRYNIQFRIHECQNYQLSSEAPHLLLSFKGLTFSNVCLKIIFFCLSSIIRHRKPLKNYFLIFKVFL